MASNTMGVILIYFIFLFRPIQTFLQYPGKVSDQGNKSSNCSVVHPNED